MLLNILKAYIIGICASMPLGPGAILVLQNSLGKGHRHGFITGLGVTVVDTLFSVIAIFALAVVESFINSNKTLILIIGGLILAVLGLTMVFKDPFRKVETNHGISYSFKEFARAVIMCLTNPAAIVVMLTLFAFFGVRLEHHDFRIAPIILALSAGSASYWFTFSGIFSHIRKKIKLTTIVWINRLSGIIVLIIGLSLLAEGLIKVLFL